MAQTVAITIGNFDGVHLGHVQLIQRARSLAGPRGRVLVFSFDPHPATILRPAAAPDRLTSWEQRTARLRESGADEVLALRPTPEFLNQSPEQFIGDIVTRHRPAFIVEGPDFRFGRARAGSVQTLRDLGPDNGFEVVVIDPVEASLDDQSLVRVSSSTIRWLLVRGRVHDAARLLGRHYEIAGPVVRGEQRGRELGVPTMNLDHSDFVLPADGVYAGCAMLPDGQRFAAAISIGIKPTFGSTARVCEAHLIGYDGALDRYGWSVQLQFLAWLRDQLTFSNIDLLVEQMKRDISRAARIASMPPPSGTRISSVPSALTA